MRADQFGRPGISTLLLAAAFALGGACTGAPGDGETAVLAQGGPQSGESRDTPQEPPFTAQAVDWEIAESKLAWASEPERRDLDFGELLGALGETFIGTTYEPQTLELPGDERLVVNLRALDCVTFVENVLALGRLARSMSPDALADSARVRRAFRAELEGLRYREGRLDGYSSRLHYFSEWLADNEARGTVDGITRQLDGTLDPEPIDFMSSHPDAYRPLADEAVLLQVAQIEARLGTLERYYIPEDQIEEKAHLIRTGDIIAATSTVPGLDIAHTGIAVWKDGVLHLLHAPLVGSSVELSEESLAERIRRISGQDGIMVARPIEPRGA